jgi:hypothetical protein
MFSMVKRFAGLTTSKFETRSLAAADTFFQRE